MMKFTPVLLFLFTIGCFEAPPPAPISIDSDLEALKEAAAWENPATTTLAVLTSLYFATEQNSSGFEFFSEQAATHPNDPRLKAFAAVFRARMSNEVGLTKRVSWVEAAIAALDEAVETEGPGGISRYLRAATLAQVPSRFEESQRALDELDSLLEDPESILNSYTLPGTVRNALRRGTMQAKAKAFEVEGKFTEANTIWEEVGGRRPETDTPIFSGWSVGAADGFRFSKKEIINPSPDVYVARGYDFANIAFVVTDAGLVVIDAGTTPETAQEAIEAFKKEVLDAPVHTLFITHAHWDHIGGIRSIAEPGTRIVAQGKFEESQVHLNDGAMGFDWFFGPGATEGPYNVEANEVVEDTQTFVIGDKSFTATAVFGGETEDGLVIEIDGEGVLFVGDVFMPYLGAPFVSEGSPLALIDSIDWILSREPTLLVHGHQPLSDFFSVENIRPLRTALGEYTRAVQEGIAKGLTIEAITRHARIPPALAEHPNAVTAAYVIRKQFMQRLHRLSTGYWQPDGSGIELIHNETWAIALDLLAGQDPDQWQKTIEGLIKRGEHAIAWQLSDRALEMYPTNPELAAQRVHALNGLRARAQLANPFKFIVFSEMANVEHPQVQTETAADL